MTGRTPRTTTTATSDAGTDGNDQAPVAVTDGGHREVDAEEGRGGSTTDPGPREEDGEGQSRRWLIRAMIALAIGIPIAIEARTLVGLVERGLFGGGGDDADGATTTRAGGVGVGDDLLPGTPRTERVADAFVSTAGGTRTFTLAVTVENTGDRPYELRIGALRTVEGDRVEGDRSTGRIPPGESESVVARWDLPGDATPDEVRVEGVTYDDGSAVDEVAEWVRIGRVETR